MRIDWDHGMSRPKIDMHCHVWPMEDWERSSDQLVYAGTMLGITEYWCSAPITGGRWASPDEVRSANDVILRAMERHPDRIRGMCFLVPGFVGEAIQEVERCLAAGMIGIKLYNQYKIDDPVVRPILEFVADRKIPLLEHSGYLTDPAGKAAQPLTSHGADFAAASRAVPEAMLIHAHIGGGGDWEWTIRALRDASSNVYVDVSGSNLDDGQVEFAVEELGVERVLFGTDGTMTGSVGKVLDASLTEEQKDLIFWGNAERILAAQGAKPLQPESESDA